MATKRDEYKKLLDALRDAAPGTVEYSALMAVVAGEENAMYSEDTGGEGTEEYWRVAYDSICYTAPFESEAVQDCLSALGYTW